MNEELSHGNEDFITDLLDLLLAILLRLVFMQYILFLTTFFYDLIYSIHFLAFMLNHIFHQCLLNVIVFNQNFRHYNKVSLT